jgi:succinyl-CoA synthetase beta subunit
VNLHEYQAKLRFAEFGIPVPRGKVAFSADEAYAIAKELGGVTVVKAQVHTGGRPKMPANRRVKFWAWTSRVM